MECICGKRMILLGKIIYKPRIIGDITVWACPPEGCGRIYLEGSPHGTWYLSETNDKVNPFD